MAVFTSNPGVNDIFVGGAGPDTFNFTVLDLTGADTLTGAGGTDTLVLTGAGAVAAASLAGMTSVEALVFGNGGISVTFNDAVVAANGSILAATGSSGNDTLDYSGVTLTRSFNIVAGAGADTLRGGASNDVFRFNAIDLTAADTVAGGGGTVDQLIFETAGTITAASLANVGGIERVILANGANDITLAAAMGASPLNGLIQVFGGTGNDRISATLLAAAARVDVTAGAGLDTLLGTAGNDTFRFAGPDLAGDTVNGGVGFDTLIISSADALSAADLALVSNIDQINLNAAGSSLTFDNTVAAANAGVLVVFASSGNDTIDASAVTSTRAISVTANAGSDTLRGGTGNDVFRFNAADLTGADTVSGGGGAGIDAINFLTAGAINLAGVSGIERLAFAAGTNSVTLTDALVSTASGGAMTIFTNSGDDTVDGSSLTGANRLEIYTGLGNDTLRGGAGNDIFRFSVDGLDGSDLVAGGAGTDQLIISNAGALTAAKLAGVSGIDQIVFSVSGVTMTLNNTVAAANAASLAVFASSGNDTVDASAVTDTTRGLSITALAGRDTFRGGLGTDSFRFNAADLTSLDIVQGGSGASSDAIVLLTAGTVEAAGLTNVSGIEALSLAAGGNAVTLTNAMVGSANNTLLTVFSSAGNDTIDAASVTTAANRIDVSANTGNESFTGGAGNDIFRFSPAELTASDTVRGGAGFDAVVFNAAGTIAAAQLGGTATLEQFTLGGSGSSITFNNAALANNAATVLIVATTGSDTVDASAVTLTTRGLNVVAQTGNDTLRGGLGTDTFQFAVANLTSADTVAGGGGAALDTLQLTTAGTVTAPNLASVSGIEVVVLANGTNVFSVTNAMVSSAANTTLAVNGGTGDDLINGGDVVTAGNRLDLTAGAGNDTLFGGAGADTFRFIAANLDGSDTVNGGVGAVVDTLAITGAGTIDLSGSNIAQIEALTTDNANHTILLDDALVSTAENTSFLVTAGSGADTLDVKRVADAGNVVQVDLGEGGDTLILSAYDPGFGLYNGPAPTQISGTLGNGNDTLKVVNSSFNGALILSGGAGTDTIEVDNYFNNTANMDVSVTGFEIVNLINTVTGSGYSTFNANDTAGLTVNGQFAGDQFLIRLGAGGQTANGNALNDSLFGGSGNDTLNGNGGADFIDGQGGANTSNGGAGDDSVVWHAGDAVVAGGADTDTLFSTTGGNFDLSQADQSLGDSVNTTGFENINLLQAYDPNSGYSVNSTVGGTAKGSSGANVINGSFFADVLDGNGGADSVFGNDGADTITYRGSEVEVNAYYAGTVSDIVQNDTLVLAAAVTVNLGNADQTLGDTVTVGGFQNVDASALSAALNLTGDVYDNRLIGSSGANTIAGNDGNDWIDGGAGLDAVTGGNGDDTITYRGTASTIGGGADTDTLRVVGAATINLNNGDQSSGDTAVVSGFEHVNGSESTVSFTATGRNNFRSMLIGGSAADTLTAGAFGADITGNGGADTLTGGAASDSFYVYAGDVVAGEVINGSGDTDYLYVRGSSNFTSAALTNLENLHAVAADQNGNLLEQGMTVTLTGAQAAGFQQVYFNGNFSGTTEAFIVNVASGTTVDLSAVVWQNSSSTDTLAINGAGGNETIIGPNIVSVIRGNGGNDTLRAPTSTGGYWADGTQVFGDAGNDRIDYGYRLYTVTLDGGADTDTLVNSYNEGVVDQIDLTSTTDQTNGDSVIVRNFESLDWSASSFGLTATGSSGANSIVGSQGADTIDGGAGLDAIDGQGGNDLITYRGTASTIGGGTDTDTLRVLGAATINLANGDQTSGDTAVVSGFENVDGSAATAAFTATGRNDVRSILIGGSAGDTLTAGTFGADITGNGGADTLTGGAASDSFYFNAGDVVSGESVNGGGDNDYLYVRGTNNFSGATLSNAEYLFATAADAAGTLLDQGMTVTLTGVQAAGLQLLYANGSFFGTTAEEFIINVASGTTVDLSATTYGNFDAIDSVAVNGAGGNETITGPGVASVIHGNGGNDTLRGASGIWAAGTQVFGDAGNDRVDYGYRDYIFTLDGGADSDTLVYSYNYGVTDVIDLTSATDQTIGDTPEVINFENLDWSASSYGLQATGTSGVNGIIGSQAGDMIDGGAGLDVIDGQGGDDLITYRGTASSIGGGDGVDTLRVVGAATINLNNADQTSGDTAVVTGFEDVNASASTAAVTATGRNDFSSTLSGGSAADTLTAGDFGAFIIGNGGADILVGGVGQDNFFLNSGDFAAGESINGGGNTDNLYVRATTDFTVGTLSNLEYLYATAADAAGNPLEQGMTVTLTGAQAAGLTAIYANGNYSTTAEAFIINVASGTTVDLSAISTGFFDANDTLAINGAGGNETIIGPNIATVIHGNGGNDTLRAPTSTGGYWADGTQVFGDAGNDRIEYGYSLYTTVLDGGADTDTLVYSYNYGAADMVDLTSATDQTIGDTVVARNFESLDWSASSYGLTATGNSGANTIIGSQSADTIDGGGGNDTIEGAGGNDTLTGGANNDVFVWKVRDGSTDTITDFLASADDLRFTASAFDFNGAAFASRLAASSTASNITGIDLVIYTGANLDTTGDVSNYLSLATGGTVGEGVFIVGQDSASHTVLYHALDASFTTSTDVVKIADLGTLTAPGSVQIADFLFV